MTIDVLSRCCWRKHFGVVGPGVLNFQVWEFVFVECVCGVNSNSVGFLLFCFLDFSCCVGKRAKLLIQDVGSCA